MWCFQREGGREALTGEFLFHSLCDGDGSLVELLRLVVLGLLACRTREMALSHDRH